MLFFILFILKYDPDMFLTGFDRFLQQCKLKICLITVSVWIYFFMSDCFRNAYMQIVFAAHANLLTVDQRQQASEAELNTALCW